MRMSRGLERPFVACVTLSEIFPGSGVSLKIKIKIRGK